MLVGWLLTLSRGDYLIIDPTIARDLRDHHRMVTGRSSYGVGPIEEFSLYDPMTRSRAHEVGKKFARRESHSPHQPLIYSRSIRMND